MKNILSIWVIFSHLAWALCVAAGEPAIDSELNRGIEAYQAGHYQHAIQALGEVLKQPEKQPPSIHMQALLLQADAYRLLGKNRLALKQLNQGSLLAQQQPTTISDRQRALLHARLGVVQYALGRTQDAEQHLEQALALGAHELTPHLLAGIYNDQALVQAKLGDFSAAQSAFHNAAKQGRASGDSGLLIQIELNRLRAKIDNGDLQGFETELGALHNTVVNTSASRQKAQHFLALGELYRRAQLTFDLPVRLRRQAFDNYQRAQRISQRQQDESSLAYALGYTAQLYEQEKRHAEALEYSRRAVFHAQAQQASESLYQWQWQVARGLHAVNDIPGSLDAYGRAIDTLREIRPNLETGTENTYKRIVGPVFYQYADVMLERAAALANGDAKQRLLSRVRDVLEEVKLAEVRDYFDNECLPLVRPDKSLDSLAAGAAVIYPVLLEKRTELLVSLPDGIRQYTLPVSRNRLTQVVRDFRQHIEIDTGTRDYLRHGQKLYSWLIAPAEGAIEAAGITTLVIIPDGPLRTIPLAALHTGREHLIAKYAVATTPSLTLTDPKPLNPKNFKVLAAGITEAVQGFRALPHVAEELANINQRLPATVYQDAAFALNTVQAEVEAGDFVIAHFATHGQFAGTYKNSFILAHDDKFTMERLSDTISKRQLRAEPLELLVLSACQTAAGDDRAALGLAGVAIKAGVRSALASLWAINDEATTKLIETFYAQLQDTSNSKAESLQQAQLSLVNEKRYKHPSNWAPFLLIGNWL